MPSLLRASVHVVALLAALCGVLTAGCDSSSTPTAPSTGALAITASRTVLRAGETLALTVTGNGSPVTTATWTTTDSSVLVVSPTGQATAGRPGRVTVTATSGTASGSLALRVVPDVAGTWAGTVARLQLTCSAASTSAVCAPGAPTGGSVTMRFTQVGDQLTGTLVDSAEPTATVPLTGQIQADDAVGASGLVDVPTTVPTLRVEASTLRATYDPTLAVLTGSYSLSVDRTRAGGTSLQNDYRAQVQFRDLRRQP